MERVKVTWIAMWSSFKGQQYQTALHFQSLPVITSNLAGQRWSEVRGASDSPSGFISLWSHILTTIRLKQHAPVAAARRFFTWAPGDGSLRWLSGYSPDKELLPSATRTAQLGDLVCPDLLQLPKLQTSSACLSHDSESLPSIHLLPDSWGYLGWWKYVMVQSALHGLIYDFLYW